MPDCDHLFRKFLQFWPVWILLAPCSCTAPQQEPERLIIVEIDGSAPAGRLAAGDVLTAWRRSDSSGPIHSRFELYRVEVEESPRGPVTLIGRRGDSKLEQVMGAAPWGLTAAPGISANLLAAYKDGASLRNEGKHSEAAAIWEERAAGFRGSESSWLLSLSARAYSDAENGTESDRLFAAAGANRTSNREAELALQKQWGDAERRRGDWNGAKGHYQQALRNAEQAKLELFRASLLYDLGTMANERRQPAEARPYLFQALDIREKLAPEGPEVAAVLNAIGLSHFIQVQVGQAAPFYQKALERIGKRALISQSHSSILQNLGLVAMSRGQFDSARDYFTKSMEIAEQVEPKGIQWSMAADSLGTLYRRRGEFAKAEPYQLEAVTIRRKLRPGSLLLASALNNIANLHRERGDLIQAESEFRESLALNEKLAPGSREVAGALLNLGTLAHSRKEWKLAESYYQRAAALWVKVAPGSVYWAGTLVNLAQVFGMLGDFQAAERCYREILAVPDWQKLSPVDAASAGRGLAQLYHNQDRLDLATAEYAKSLDVLQKAMPASLDVAEIYFSQGDIARRNGQWDDAERLHRQALAIRRQLAPGSSDLAESLYALAIIASQMGRIAEAEHHLIASIEALEAQLARVGGSETTVPAYRANYQEPYERLVELQADRGRLSEAFQWLERSRGRALLEQLARRNPSFSEVPAELARQIRENGAEYDKAQNASARLSANDDKAAIEKLQSHLLELNAERGHLEDRVRRAAPRVAALRRPVPLTLQQTRAALDPGTILLAYQVGANRTLLFVVEPPGGAPGVTIFNIKVKREELAAKIEAFRSACTEKRFIKIPEISGQARALYDLLLRPAEGLLAKGKRLLIVPDGPLHGLSFAALRTAGDRYLVESMPVHTAISTTLYAELKLLRRPADSYPIALLAFGDPDYGSAPAGAAGSVPLPASAPFAVLRSARSEVTGIAELYSSKAQTYLGADATEERAKAAGAGIRTIHFAVHAVLDERNPLNSALVLSSSKKPDSQRENGLLQAWELYQSVRWPVDLVVMSACESGAGQHLQGEGLISLTRAVHFAGARSVLSTQWAVSDSKTAQLMTAFHRFLRDGQSKDEALRSAQMEMIHSRTGHMPFFWAAFTLQGDWK